jgi:hypothetical protein
MTLDTERDGLLDALDAGESAAWRQGRHWHNIVAFALWKDGRFRSPKDFLKKSARSRKVPDTTQLSKWAAVSVAFEEPIAIREGMDRLLRLLEFRKKSGRPGKPGDPADEPIDIPHDGHVLTKRFGDCTEQELRAALRAPKKKVKAPPLSVSAKAFSTDLEAVAKRNALAWSVRDAAIGSLLVSLQGPTGNLRTALNLQKAGSDKIDTLHSAAVTTVQAEIVRFFDGTIAPTFSARLDEDGTLRYSLINMSDANYSKVLEAARTVLEDFWARQPAPTTAGDASA